MSILRYFRKVELLDYFIRRKATGNQKEFAHKTGMSKSMLNEYLKEMKEMGFPIEYDREHNSYFYDRQGRMVKTLFKEDLDESEMKKYHGGCTYFRLDEVSQPIIPNWFER